MTPLTVSSQPHDASWTCAVTVGDDLAATHHQVGVEAADLERLQPGAADPQALVRAAFDFLLTREPRESSSVRCSGGPILRARSPTTPTSTAAWPMRYQRV